MKTVKCSLCLLLCFVLLSFTCFAAGMVVSVVSFETQQKTNWCWVTSAINSVHHEMSSPRSQKAVVKHIKGSTTNPYPNVGGNISDIEVAAEYASKGSESYYGTNGTYSFSFLKNQISVKDNVTVMCFGTYNSDNVRISGHAVAMTGYAVNSNGDYVQFFDPYNGNAGCIYKYSALFNGGYNNSIYDQTCYNTES